MRKRSEKELEDAVFLWICKTQARLYEYAADKGYEMEAFSNLFLTSDFCSRMFDTDYSRYQTEFPPEIMDFLLPEIGDKLEKPGTFFDVDVANWMGYMYRRLYIETGIPSRELVKIFPFSLMCNTYPGLHTVDDSMAVDKLCEPRGIMRCYQIGPV